MMGQVGNFIAAFLMGAATIFWLLSRTYEFVKHPEPDGEEPESDEELEEVDANFDEQESDDDHYYYVKLPDRDRPIQIAVEEKLALNHIIAIKGSLYVVYEVLHKVDGHTVYVLGNYKRTI